MAEKLFGDGGQVPGALEVGDVGVEEAIDGTTTITQTISLSFSAERIPGSGLIIDNLDPGYSESGSGWTDFLTGGDSSILSDWTLGTTHAAIAGTSRIGIVVASLEDPDAVAAFVSWGGRPITTSYTDVLGSATKNRMMVGYVREVDIAQMVGGSIITSGDTIDSITSAFYDTVDQSVPFPSACNRTLSNVDPTIACTSFISIAAGEAAFIAASANTPVNISSLSTDFVEKIDNDTANQTLAIANRTAGNSTSVQSSVTWDGSTGRKLIYSAAIGSVGGFPGDAYNGTARQHASGAGSNTAIFAATGLPASVSLMRIYAWWPTISGAATDTNFVFTGKYSDSVVVNQNINQGTCNLIKTFGSSASGTTLTVTIDDDANGIVLADAIKIEWEVSTLEGPIAYSMDFGFGVSAGFVASSVQRALTSNVLFLK